MDLISRQAAIDEISEYGSGNSVHMSVGELKRRIEQLPSAQPEQSEIVRCKDCRHNKDCNIQYHAQAGEEFYCGAAERRTDE